MLDGRVNYPVLYRPVNTRVLGGVCAGIGQRLNIDPNLVRIAFVVLSFVAGIGIAGYLTGMAVIPRQGNVDPPITKILGFTRNWSFPVLAGVTFVVLVIAFGGANGSFGVAVFPIGIIVLIVYLRNKRRRNPRQLTPEPTPFERSADAWRQRLAQNQNLGTSNYQPGYPQIGYPEPPFIPPIPTSPTSPPQNEAARKAMVTSRVRQSWLIAAGLICVSLAGLILTGASPFFYAVAITGSLFLGLLWSARTKLSKGLLWTTIVVGLASASWYIQYTRGWSALVFAAPFALVGLGLFALIMALRKH